MKEIFVDIIGYEGLYQISNMGRVKSMERKVNHRYGLRTVRESIIIPAKKDNDYLFVGLSENCKVTRFYIHRLVALHFIDNPENKPDINHKESNKSDNRFFMLEWATKSENILHSFQHGTHRPQDGRLSSSAKLTDENVLEIKRRYVAKKSYERGGISIRQLSSEYGVHHSVIDGILKGKRWKHLKTA